MDLVCLISLAIAIGSFNIGTHLSEEAEGITVLALVACLGSGVLCLIYLPIILKLAILLVLLGSKLYWPASHEPTERSPHL
ncbi:MAG: hypothetical protein VKK04_11720 [Synechococcales bacterium]|nr:hypothetical protein [Synechococcales bacterium]